MSETNKINGTILLEISAIRSGGNLMLTVDSMDESIRDTKQGRDRFEDINGVRIGSRMRPDFIVVGERFIEVSLRGKLRGFDKMPTAVSFKNADNIKTALDRLAEVVLRWTDRHAQNPNRKLIMLRRNGTANVDAMNEGGFNIECHKIVIIDTGMAVTTTALCQSVEVQRAVIEHIKPSIRPSNMGPTNDSLKSSAMHSKQCVNE